MTQTVRALATAGIEVEDIALRRPTLDEVFLHLTADATGETRPARVPETGGPEGGPPAASGQTTSVRTEEKTTA